MRIKIVGMDKRLRDQSNDLVSDNVAVEGRGDANDVVLYGPQWHVDFLVSLAINMWPVGGLVHRQSVLFVLVGARKSLYLLLGKQ